MTNYIEINGTKEQIIEQFMAQSQNINSIGKVTKQDIGFFLDIIEQNRDFLSDDEMFEKRMPDYDGGSKFIMSGAKYYISIKKFTLFIISLMVTKIPIPSILEIMGIKFEGTYLAKLDSALGESCILIEAFRKKKKGINKNLFKENNGECINAHLCCNYNMEGRCTCSAINVEDICEGLVDKEVLLKKRGKYFYLDII